MGQPLEKREHIGPIDYCRNSPTQRCEQQCHVQFSLPISPEA